MAAADANNGLNAEIFGDRILQKSLIKRIDPNVDWFWAKARPHRDVPADHFSIRWTGYIKAPQAARYKLILMGDDGFRLYLDDKKVIDEWRGGRNEHAATVELTGEPQKIQIDYFEIDKGAWISFWWQPLGFPIPSIVPSDALFPDEQSARAKLKKTKAPSQGLVADYFDNDFKKRYGRGLVHRTEAIWGEWSPKPGVPVDGAVRYTGFLVPENSGTYQLIAFADDRMRLWIDDRPILEATFDPNRGHTSALVDLEADTAYAISIEFKDTGGRGAYFLHWIPPGESEESYIPTECLYPARQSLPKGIKMGGK